MKQLFVPDGWPAEAAMRRIRYLGIGAHCDDLEFMAFHGIVAGYHDRSFGGVTVTGTDEIRRQEQIEAAKIGRYGVMIQLGHPSKDLTGLRDELHEILSAMKPEVVYTHNPADKHPTHIAVLKVVIEALREFPPARVIGCEVWRDLDWLPDKVVMDVSGHETLAAELNAVFKSQLAGKRYDLAVEGRRRANATFFESHSNDKATSLIFGMDLTPVIRGQDLQSYVAGLIDKFKADVTRQCA
jgi:LmbE family N-acetylglucosaminyl deacetylase